MTRSRQAERVTEEEVPLFSFPFTTGMHATAPVACGQAVIVAGYAVLFVRAMTPVANLAKAHTGGKPEEKLTHFAMPKLLIVDAVVVTAILECLTRQVHP